MPKQPKVSGVPAPWSEMLRRHWPKVHTVEVNWRSNNKAGFTSVPSGALVLPELDDGEHEGPAAAGQVAGIMYAKCWAHLESVEDDDVRRLFYQLSCWSLDDGGLRLIEATTVGGGLKRDGSVEHESDDDASDGERRRAREDQHTKDMAAMASIVIRLAEKFPAILERVEPVVSTAIDARYKVATAEREAVKDELDAETERMQTEEAGKAFDKLLTELGPVAKMYMASEMAKASAAKPSREPHESAAVEHARLLLDQLDGPTMARLSLVIAAEAMQDIMTALVMSLDDACDVPALREAWLAAVPPLMAKQTELAAVLDDDKAQALGATIIAFHSEITRAAAA